MRLIRPVALLVLDFSFDIFSGVTGLDLDDDGPVTVFTEICISASAAWLPVEEKGRNSIHPTNYKQQCYFQEYLLVSRRMIEMDSFHCLLGNCVILPKCNKPATQAFFM